MLVELVSGLYLATLNNEESIPANARLVEIDVVESAVLHELNDYRIKGRSGRRNGWLSGIEPEKIVEVVLTILIQLGLAHQVILDWKLR